MLALRKTFSSRRASPLSQAVAPPSPQSPESLWLGSASSDGGDTTATSQHSFSEKDADSEREEEFVDARGSIGASSSREVSEDEEDGLDALTRGAAALLDQLEDAMWEVPSQRRQPRAALPLIFNSRPVVNELNWNLSPSSPDRPRPTPLELSPKTLARPASTSTLRRAPRLSFTQTDLASLDIDAILSEFEDVLNQELVVPARDVSQERTPTQQSHNLAILATPSDYSMSSVLFPSRSQLPSSKSQSSNPSRGPRPNRNSSALPYADLFPAPRVDGPFPTRRKSTTSLGASPKPPATANLAPPLPETLSPNLSKQRASVASTSTSVSSSTRSSYISSGDSFRWSVASGSTAPTVAEEDACYSRRGSAASSTLLSRSSLVPSSPPRTAVSFPKMSNDADELGYEDFLKELAEEASATVQGGDPDPFRVGRLRRAVSFAPQTNKASSTSPQYKYPYVGSQPVTPTLDLPHASRSASSVALHKIRSCASLSPPPAIPSRSTSLLSGLSPRQKGKQRARFVD